MKTTYNVTIGLEIHAELKTASKMFCDCVNNPHHAEANTNICPVCTAQPGTLPSVNKEAIESVLKVGKALGSQLAKFTEFDRKNYFYPDIPKAYQISQYQFPLVTGGELAGVAITRIHLEEDTARNLHDQTEGSVVDFNRAGVPLMELVTEPVIHDEKTAVTFARELQLLLRMLKVSDANMEKGEMRVEANISISKSKEKLGTKVEVKNLNSFKSVEAAISYEVLRQTEIIEKGEKVKQETRGWDESKMKTFSQRIKEKADDYRYFPDPDIPKFNLARIDDFSDSRLNEKMPILPKEIRNNWMSHEINNDIIEVIINDITLTQFLNDVIQELENDSQKSRLAANYVASDVQGLLVSDNVIHKEAPKQFAKLINMLDSKAINSRIGKDLLPKIILNGVDPEKIVDDLGLKQESSPEELSKIAKEIILEHKSVVAEYKAGKEASLQFLLGQGMKKTKGKANPIVLKEVLVKEINS